MPIVFNAIIQNSNDKTYYLTYGGAEEKLTFKFEPTEICMLNSGRVYHPSSERTGGIGLIKSSLAIEISPNFVYDNKKSSFPTHFNWDNSKFKLTHKLYEKYNLINKDYEI